MILFLVDFLVVALLAVVVSVAVTLVVSANTLTGSMGCSMTGTFTVAVILGGLPLLLGCVFWASYVTAELVEAVAVTWDSEAVELVSISMNKLGNKS